MPIIVWSRFEKKKKDGTVLKLRIQDLPSSHCDKVTELMLHYYATEEPCQRAVGTANCPATAKIYADYLKDSLLDPNFSCVICCCDSDEVIDIIGISAMFLTKDYTCDLDKEKNKPVPKQWAKYYEICTELFMHYNPMEKHNLSTFYDDRGLLVIPQFRGLGIAVELLKSRRIICEARGVPMAGAWMSSIGTQIAASRDGWEIESEIYYDGLAMRHGVVFDNVPPTMKYMVTRVGSSKEAKEEI